MNKYQKNNNTDDNNQERWIRTIRTYPSTFCWQTLQIGITERRLGSLASLSDYVPADHWNPILKTKPHFLVKLKLLGRLTDNNSNTTKSIVTGQTLQINVSGIEISLSDQETTCATRVVTTN